MANIKHIPTGEIHKVPDSHPMVQRIKDGLDDYELVEDKKPVAKPVVEKKEPK